jgi:hypothetical protein
MRAPDGRRVPIQETIDSMRQNGWNDNPANRPTIVEHPDGRLTTLDHRRLVAADEAGITEVPARVVQASDPVPATDAGRYRLQIDITDPSTGRSYSRGAVPDNYGEAAPVPCGESAYPGIPDFPLDGSTTDPSSAKAANRVSGGQGFS